MGRDGFSPRQFPGARAVSKRLRGQRPDRAHVDHVSGQFRVHRPRHEWHDFRMLAASGHAKLHDAGDLLAKTHATRAVDAAGHLLGRNQRPEVLVGNHALWFIVARAGASVANGEILQLAFASLVADRAVERMIDQQKLHHAFLRRDRDLGMRVDPHAFGHRRGASRQRLGRLLHLHQTHAAVRGNRELAVIAKMRHVDAELGRGIHDHAVVRYFHRPAVYFELCHERGFGRAVSVVRERGTCRGRCDAETRPGNA